MEIFHAILLGILQGLTEFLPISSSGHLVIVQELFDIEGASLAFDVILHLGTLVAVMFFYREDIWGIIKELFVWISELAGTSSAPKNKNVYKPQNNPYRVLLLMIVVGTIPAVIIGFTLKDIFRGLFESVSVVGFTLLITGGMLWISNHMLRGRKQMGEIKIADAVIVGIFQSLAITPGISRSGSTIFGGLLRGFDRELATKFSFLLSIPAILGAAVLEGKEVLESQASITNITPIISGFVAAAISGYFAIKLLIGLLNQRKLYFFSYYCWALGVFIILYSLV